ncbi:MAG: cellulase family glycosylhydrolase, partial [Thermoleophilaceae bacterium]|nr:cellulase family glycosylhydrolase [Thermoleophilaceae bacterium]
MFSTGLVLAGQAVPASAAPPPYRGVTVHSLSNEQVGDMDRTLDSAKALGANVVRVDVWWSVLEQEGKGKYTRWYLDRFDRFVKGAHARGMKVLPVLLWTPCWASSAPKQMLAGCSSGTQKYPPKSASDYGDFARFVATRYGSRLAGIEVWNEPNLLGFLSGSDPARSYTKLVKAAYSTVKSVNRSLTVVAGGLSGADRSFLEALYRRGMRGHYDVLSIHPYNGANAPDAKLGNP